MINKRKSKTKFDFIDFLDLVNPCINSLSVGSLAILHKSSIYEDKELSFIAEFINARVEQIKQIIQDFTALYKRA